MRHLALLLSGLVLVSAAACAAQQVPRPTTSPRYACGDVEVVRAGETVRASSPRAITRSPLGWHDDDGDHFVAFPSSPTDVEAIEYVLPADPYADAIMRVHDASQGRSRVDWRMTSQRVCRAEGGYNDVLLRWASGSSFDQVASELSLKGGSHARAMVHQALLSMNKRYYSDR